MDGPRVCYTELSKSEREKRIPYANTYIWNLKKKKKVLKNLGAGGEGGVHSHPLKKLSSGTSTQCNTLSASVCVCVGVGVCVRGVR